MRANTRKRNTSQGTLEQTRGDSHQYCSSRLRTDTVQQRGEHHYHALLLCAATPSLPIVLLLALVLLCSLLRFRFCTHSLLLRFWDSSLPFALDGRIFYSNWIDFCTSSLLVRFFALAWFHSQPRFRYQPKYAPVLPCLQAHRRYPHHRLQYASIRFGGYSCESTSGSWEWGCALGVGGAGRACACRGGVDWWDGDCGGCWRRRGWRRVVSSPLEARTDPRALREGVTGVYSLW